jgi:UDP-N-acetylglucosamine 1-carboxyvinyltransferase
LNLDNIDDEAAKKTRSIIMFMGALIHKKNKFSLPYAGGCHLGKRTIAAHQFALEQLGVKIQTVNGQYNVISDNVHQAEITMYEASDTATENLLIAASLIPEQTIIRFAASNYMVQDLCAFLRCSWRKNRRYRYANT